MASLKLDPPRPHYELIFMENNATVFTFKLEAELLSLEIYFE